MVEGRRIFGGVFPFLKGGNSAFFAAKVSGMFLLSEYRSLEIRSNLLKLGNLMLFTPCNTE